MGQCYCSSFHCVILHENGTKSRAGDPVIYYLLLSCLQLRFRILICRPIKDPSAVFRSTLFELTMCNAFKFRFAVVFTVGCGEFIPYRLLSRTWMVFVGTHA